MLMKLDLEKLKNCRFFSMVQLLVVIEMTTKKISVFYSIENYSNDYQRLDHRKKIYNF